MLKQAALLPQSRGLFVLKKIDDIIKNINKRILVGGLLSTAFLLFYLNLVVGPSVSFVVPYIILIWLTVVYAGDSYAYLVAVLTAASRSYVAYTGYSPDESNLLIASWQFISNLVVHLLFCYLFTVQNKIFLFLKPDNNQFLKEEISKFPSIREFVFRPYVNRYWNLSKRLNMIDTHYRLVENHVPFLNIPPAGSIEFLKFTLNNQDLRVVIDRPNWMRREGEIGISFFYGIDRVYISMFLLSGTPDNLILIVGNLQGDNRNRAALYKDITKAMHGMRPPDLLFNILKILGEELGCKEILGVSDDAHRSSHYLSKAYKLLSYDKTWIEHGGLKDDKSGLFHIPSRIIKKSEEDIPTHKRALYRRRYQLLDDLQLQIRTIVSSTPGRNTNP